MIPMAGHRMAHLLSPCQNGSRMLLVTRRLSSSYTGICKEDGYHTGPEIKDQYTTVEQCNPSQFNVSKCQGNFVTDKNDNVLLDLYQLDGSLALGYNNPALVEETKKHKFSTSLIQSYSSNACSSKEYLHLLEKTLYAISPKGLCYVQTTDHLTNPTQAAIDMAVEKFKNKMRQRWHRSYKGFSNIDKISRKHFSVLSLHGPVHAFPQNCPYPVEHISLPSLNYSKGADRFVSNESQESKCLEQCYESIKNCIYLMRHPAAMVVDPTLHGKDVFSCNFYHSLQVLCKEFDISLIVNEVDSCLGVTGSMWAHEYWNLPEPPDFVVFGKKLMTSGFYYKEQCYMPNEKFDNDIVGLHLLAVVLKYISENDLFARADSTAKSLRKTLTDIADSYPNLIDGVYCNGTTGAVAFVDESVKQEVQIRLLNKGLNLGGGSMKNNMIFVRPALILDEKHINYVQDHLCTTLHDLALLIGNKLKFV